jgi:hypothetical protein
MTRNPGGCLYLVCCKSGILRLRHEVAISVNNGTPSAFLLGDNQNY